MTPDRANLERSISAATRAILDCQKPDGEWCFELEADCTIPAEYVLMRHYLGEPVDFELPHSMVYPSGLVPDNFQGYIMADHTWTMKTVAHAGT